MSTSPVFHLRIDGISVAYADRRVLTDVSMVVASGQRIGLIGENGSGKSTLLRIAAGVAVPDTGSVSVAGGNARSGLLYQEHPFGEGDTVESAVEAAIAHIRGAAAAVQTVALQLADDPEDETLAQTYADALDQAEWLSVWNIDSRVSAMLSGLGLGAITPSRPVAELSGGQRARLALACLLLHAPEVLLLDEPTNHLDDAATKHLLRMLTSWRGPVLLASHDRAFLDEAVTGLVDLDPQPGAQLLAGDDPATGLGTAQFTGSYSDYLVARADARSRWERQYRDEQAELKRLAASVRGNQVVGHDDWKPRSESRIARKFYADRNAKVVSRRVNDARSRLEELEGRQVRKPPEVLRFQGLAAAERGALDPARVEESRGAVGGGDLGGGGSPIVLTDVSVAGRLAPVTITVEPGEKLLVTGPNGSGKSTLLQLIAGELQPTGGRAGFDPRVRVGMLTQDVTLPDPRGRGAERTVQQTYVDLVGVERAERTPLSSFGLIAGRDERRRLAVLSIGQQRRLALAILLANPPEVLLLDEPTNHLSLSLATELETAVGEYGGTVIVASHDRWLRRRWSGKRLRLAAAVPC